MRLTSILRIGVVSLILTMGGRAALFQAGALGREHLTDEVCHLVGNYLETSSVRSAFEGMQQGIDRSSYSGACISIIEAGRHYGPDCVEPGVHYQLTLCKAEGNRGIHAEIHYPVAPFIGLTVLGIWLGVWAILLGLLFGVRASASYFAKRITEELRARLFSETSEEEKRGTLARLTNWFVIQSGILRGVHAQTQKFESQIREYEGRIRTEAVLRAQKEVEAQKSKERLEEIKNIRHDLGSPLSSLLSVQEQFVGDDLSRQALASGIDKIHKMLDRLGQSESEVDAPRLTIVEAVVEEAVALLSAKFWSAKKIDLSLKYDAKTLSPVNATSEGLMRILNNLLENAFDASSAGGAIRVLIESDEKACRISVEDNGCGVSPEVVPRLFEKGATFGKVNGTGYGLYQCKASVELWKGTVEMQPLPQGTRFVITLPKLQAGVAFVGLPSAKRLWVIDDDRTVAEVLDQSGYEVVGSALTFAEGAALLKSPIPENVTVLVDYRLDDEQFGTDLIAGHKALQQMYLCTNDFENLDVIKRARQIGVRIIPKPLCYLAEARGE